MLFTRNINISNTSASHNNGNGLEISHSISVHIDDITVNKNIPLQSEIIHGGIFATDADNIVINNTVSMYNQFGITFDKVTASQIENTITSNNEVTGIFLLLTRNINISNTSASHNNGNGIEIYHSISVHFDDITVNKNIPLQSEIIHGGIFATDADNIVINNTVSMYNQLGITFDKVTASQIENTIASNNTVMGMTFAEIRNINISNITVSHNAIHGLLIDSSTNFHINNITIYDNTEYGIYLFQTKWVYISRFTTVNRKSISNYLKFIGIEGSRYISIYDTNITVNMSVASSGELSSQPAVIALHDSTLNLSKCIFMGNRITAIKAIASNITLSGNMTFSNNSAYTGSAFILIDNSILILAENCRVHFINNYATNTGGVFSISNTQKFKYMYKCLVLNFVSFCIYNVVPRSKCFLKTQMDNSSMDNFIFTNNSAGKGGDIVYGGHVAYGLNGNKNCMDTFKEISNISEASLSLVSSDPLRVCLCNESELPDCMLLVDPTSHFIYPGQTISISAVVVGQNWGTVAGSVYAQFLHKSTAENTIHLMSSQSAQNVNKDSCNSLHYTIFSTSGNLQQTLVFTAQDLYVTKYQEYHGQSRSYLPLLWEALEESIDNIKLYNFASLSVAQTLYYRTNPVYINISLLPCPPGFQISNSKCDCNKLLQQVPGVQCFIQEQTIGRSGPVWVGMIDDDNGTNGTVAASQYCPLNYCSKATSNVTLSESDLQCRYTITQVLCVENASLVSVWL